VGEIRQDARTSKPAFDRGIHTYPAVGAWTYEVLRSELTTIYDYGGDETIIVGRLSQEASIEATLRVQDLLQKHFAILGTTGCGKSSAVALLLRQILDVSSATRVLLIDPHNEYRGAFPERAEVVSPRNLNLPFWLFNFEEITDVFYRRRPGVEEEIDALADLIRWRSPRIRRSRNAQQLAEAESGDDGAYTVDSPVPYRISDLIAADRRAAWAGWRAATTGRNCAA
jgi:DNA helicase HerA-like ATPase